MQKTLKYSRQREELYKILSSVKTHPTADWLYSELRKVIPNVSLGTVYRNLNLLQEAGLIQKIEVGTPTDHFDANADNHYHFVCKKCEKVQDVDMPLISELDEKAKSCVDGTIERHSLLFYGVCRECQEAENN